LIAISAITQHINASLKDDYVAGMWQQQDLAGQLLWILKEPEVARQTKDFIASFWSWACFNAQLTIAATWNGSRLAGLY
jgi:hypothetical protein